MANSLSRPQVVARVRMILTVLGNAANILSRSSFGRSGKDDGGGGSSDSELQASLSRLLGDSCARASLQSEERFLFNVGVAISQVGLMAVKKKSKAASCRHVPIYLDSVSAFLSHCTHPSASQSAYTSESAYVLPCARCGSLAVVGAISPVHSPRLAFVPLLSSRSRG